MSLVYELCRKREWCKPSFHVRKVGPGYTCKVVLKKENKKTKDVVTRVLANKLVYTSQAEAKHMGAVFALHHMGHKSMHCVLPPGYEDPIVR